MTEEEIFRRHMKELMDRPEGWLSLELDILKQLTYFQCLLFGTTEEMAMVPRLGRLYSVLTERAGEGDRLQVLDYVVRSLESRIGGVNSLLPFIFGDPEVTVVSAASFALAVLIPLEDEDPMTGPKTVRSICDNAEDETALLGMLTGLLFLGDRRTVPLLDVCWERLGRDARGRLAASWPGVAYASHVDFLLGWMESSANDEEVHMVGEALAEIPGRGEQNKVIDIQRKFPANRGDDLPAIRILQEWTFPEYGERIEPRLTAMMRQDTVPAVVPKVIRVWRDR